VRAIEVIEIRKAANGYVVTALSVDAFQRGGGTMVAPGYVTYVVESEDPTAVGAAVAMAIKEHGITQQVAIPIARGA
jgi:hypothetical protein